MKPKISIIIPCYNVEKYIDRCVNSLVKQSIGLVNLELIFVNDASTDSTLNMLMEFEKAYPDNIMVIDLPENCRQGTARNIGLNYASAEYIGFVDSDDWVEESMYEKLYNKIIKYNCDVVCCNNFTDYSNGRIEGNAKGEDLFITISSESVEERRQFINLSLGSGVWSKLYRKSLIIENAIYFPEKLTYEDNYWISILRFYIKSFYMLQENLYHYSVNVGSTTRLSNSTHHLDRLNIELMKIDKYKGMCIFDTYHDEFEVEFLNYFYVNTLHILFIQFEPIPMNIIFYMVKCVLEIFPNYKNNSYYMKKTRSQHEFFQLLDMNLNENEWTMVANEYRRIYKERY